MSQSEPYVVIKRTGDKAVLGRSFTTLAAARSFAKKNGYNTIGQKRRGHAGVSIVESVTPGRGKK